MGASQWFLTSITIFLIFNIMYFAINPQNTFDLLLSTLTGFIATVIGIAFISGLQVVGSGFNAESTRILFGSALLLSFLYRISFKTFAGFPTGDHISIGLGLVNNYLSIFPLSILYGLPYMIGIGIAFIATASGLIIISSPSGSG